MMTSDSVPMQGARSHPPQSRPRGRAKIHKVLHEYKEGDLKSSSGQKVTSRDQALAIAMSEAGMSKRKKKR